MDGDLRPRFRSRVPSAASYGPGWGYSATIPADLGHPMTGHADVQALREPEPRTRPPETRPPEKRQPDTKPEAKADDATKKPMPRWKKALYWLIALAILAALIVAGTLYYLNARHFESTDDAFIDGHMSQVSAQVAARVTRLAVDDNQLVTAGQVILQLDPRDFQIKLDQANAQRAQAAAQLLQAKAQLQLQQANLDQAQAQVRVSQADLGQQQTDLARYRAIDPRAITRQQLDTTSAQTKSASARVDASQQAVEAARAQVESQKAQIEAAAANVEVADVAVANAQLQLGYTNVLAPAAGRITRRTVEVGNYISPGQSLLAVVPPDLWITANFKETQLADMKQGQHVRVEVDACPGVKIDAHVDSIQDGTGAVFSSLPAENATGNYVKVVQRVPVKLRFDHPVDNCNLALGLSVTPRVTVR